MSAEEKIKKIKLIFDEECCWNWTEVLIQSMYENGEAYIAKAIYVDTTVGKYRDINFYSAEYTKKIVKTNGAIINNIQAEASGETIDEAVSNLLLLINEFIKSNYQIVPDGL